MKYLVVSEDVIKGDVMPRLFFPCIVDVTGYVQPDDVVALIFERRGLVFNPRHGKSYIVVPMEDAKRVVFKKKQDYDITIEDL